MTVLSPVPAVHLAAVDDDVVALDLRTDAYFCLPDLALHLVARADGGWTPSSAAVADGLLQTGLFQPGLSRAPGAVPAPVQTSRSSVRQTSPSSSAVLLTVIAREAWRINGRSVRDLLDQSPSRPVRPERGEEAMAEAQLFDRWCTWIPGQGQCLYRAYLLRAFLAARGHGAAWVFGVRTWPFAAHCWLQIGDILLDDDLDRVSVYTPILKVGA